MNVFSSFFPELAILKIPQEGVLEPTRLKLASFWALLTAFIVLNNIVWFTPTLGGAYYAVLIGILAIVMLSAGKIRLNIEMLLIYLACFCSIYFNDIPSFFKSEYRLISFIAITLLVSPAISSNFLAVFRIKLFRNMLIGIVLLVLLSFASRFVGLSKSQGAYWCGIVNHSMTLGPVCGIAFITVLSDWIVAGKNYTTAKKFCLIITIIATLACLFGASSRAAILATVMGTIIVTGAHFKANQIFKWGTLITIALVLSTPLWSPLWDTVMAKNQNSETLSLSSREVIWQQRIDEFRSHPVFGTGFGTVDIEAEASLFNEQSGQVETGSSWLSILSMTGLVGIFAFLLLQYNTIFRFMRLTDRKSMILLLGLLFFWYGEMCAEGFWFAAGSFECFFLWLLWGCFDAALCIQDGLAKSKIIN